jgi:hypothetical protein
MPRFARGSTSAVLLATFTVRYVRARPQRSIAKVGSGKSGVRRSDVLATSVHAAMSMQGMSGSILAVTACQQIIQAP